MESLSVCSCVFRVNSIEVIDIAMSSSVMVRSVTWTLRLPSYLVARQLFIPTDT